MLDEEEYYLKNWKNMFKILKSTKGPSGYKHSEEIKRVISRLAKGRKVTKKTKEKLKEIFSGEGNPFYGRRHTFEFKEKLKVLRKGEGNPMYGKDKSAEFKEYMKRERSGGLNHNAISYAVKDIITGDLRIYSTYKEAVESIGGSKAGVRKAVNKKRLYKSRWRIEKASLG